MRYPQTIQKALGFTRRRPSRRVTGHPLYPQPLNLLMATPEKSGVYRRSCKEGKRENSRGDGLTGFYALLGNEITFTKGLYAILCYDNLLPLGRRGAFKKMLKATSQPLEADMFLFQPQPLLNSVMAQIIVE